MIGDLPSYHFCEFLRNNNLRYLDADESRRLADARTEGDAEGYRRGLEEGIKQGIQKGRAMELEAMLRTAAAMEQAPKRRRRPPSTRGST